MFDFFLEKDFSVLSCLCILKWSYDLLLERKIDYLVSKLVFLDQQFGEWARELVAGGRAAISRRGARFSANCTECGDGREHNYAFSMRIFKNNIKRKILPFWPSTENTFPPSRLLREALDLMALAVDRAYQIFIKIPRVGDNEEQFVGLWADFLKGENILGIVALFCKQSYRVGAAVCKLFLWWRGRSSTFYSLQPQVGMQKYIQTHIQNLPNLTPEPLAIPYFLFSHPIPFVICARRGEAFLCLSFSLQMTYRKP